MRIVVWYEAAFELMVDPVFLPSRASQRRPKESPG